MISYAMRFTGFNWTIVLPYALLFGGLSVVLHWIEFNHQLQTLDPQWAFLFVAVLFSGIGVWFGVQMPWKTHLLQARQKKVIQEVRTYSALPLGMESLSEREQEVLQAMAAGKSNQEIANDLFIALSTVKSHVSNILRKTDAKRRTQAIQIAKSVGWLT